MAIQKDNTKLLLFGQETERLLFRKLDKADFDDWLRFCKHPDSLRYIPMGDSKDPEEQCKAWFDRVFNRYQNNLGGMNALIDKQTNKLIGQCGLLVQTVDGVEELEIGYSMMPEFRGMGYASEASQKCKAYAFEHHLADSIISIIHIDNIDSANVALKNGMKPEKQTLFRNMEANIFRVYKP